MQGYTVHLLFHLLAIAVGAACGAAAGLWWFAGNAAAFWLTLAALVMSFVVLVLHTLYLVASPPTASRPAPRTRSARDSDIRGHNTHAARARAHPAVSGRSATPRHATGAHGGTRPDLNPVEPPVSDSVDQQRSAAADEETKTSATEALNTHWNSSR